MRKFNFWLALGSITLAFLLFSGCQSSFRHFGEFSVKRLKNGCKVVTDGVGRRLLLVPRGREAPGEYKEIQRVEIPVERVVTYSGMDAARLETLGVVDSIAGVVNQKEDWYIPEIREGMEEGRIVYLGEYTSIDYERLRVINPDVVFTYDEGVIPKLKELNIPCVITSTKLAKDLPAHIGFIQFLSTFYNEEEKAKAFVENQFKKIDEITAKRSETKKGLKTVWGDIHEKKVLVEPGNSWPAQLVEKAGGSYLFHDLQGAA